MSVSDFPHQERSGVEGKVMSIDMRNVDRTIGLKTRPNKSSGCEFNVLVLNRDTEIYFTECLVSAWQMEGSIKQQSNRYDLYKILSNHFVKNQSFLQSDYDAWLRICKATRIKWDFVIDETPIDGKGNAFHTDAVEIKRHNVAAAKLAEPRNNLPKERKGAGLANFLMDIQLVMDRTLGELKDALDDGDINSELVKQVHAMMQPVVDSQERRLVAAFEELEEMRKKVDRLLMQISNDHNNLKARVNNLPSVNEFSKLKGVIYDIIVEFPIIHNRVKHKEWFAEFFERNIAA